VDEAPGDEAPTASYGGSLGGSALERAVGFASSSSVTVKTPWGLPSGSDSLFLSLAAVAVGAPVLTRSSLAFGDPTQRDSSATGARWVSVVGAVTGHWDRTFVVKFGNTAGASTRWTSSSSLMVRSPTVSDLIASASASVSPSSVAPATWASPIPSVAVAPANPPNGPATAAVAVTMSGVIAGGLELAGGSVHARFGTTGGEATRWLATSSLSAKLARSEDFANELTLGVGVTVGVRGAVATTGQVATDLTATLKIFVSEPPSLLARRSRTQFIGAVAAMAEVSPDAVRILSVSPSGSGSVVEVMIAKGDATTALTIITTKVLSTAPGSLLSGFTVQAVEINGVVHRPKTEPLAEPEVVTAVATVAGATAGLAVASSMAGLSGSSLGLMAAIAMQLQFLSMTSEMGGDDDGNSIVPAKYQELMEPLLWVNLQGRFPWDDDFVSPPPKSRRLLDHCVPLSPRTPILDRWLTNLFYITVLFLVVNFVRACILWPVFASIRIRRSRPDQPLGTVVPHVAGFPGLDWIILQLLFMGMCQATGLAMKQGCSETIAVCILFLVCGPLAATVAIGISCFRGIHLQRRAEFRAIHCNFREEWRARAPGLRGGIIAATDLWWKMRASGEWVAVGDENVAWLRRRRIYLQNFSGRRFGYLYICWDLFRKIWIGISFSAFSALSQVISIAVVYIADVIVIFATRPHRDRFQYVMEGCVALTRVGLLAVVMLMANEHIGIDTGSRGMLAMSAAGLLVCVAFVFFTLVMAFGYLLAKYWKRSQPANDKAQQADEQHPVAFVEIVRRVVPASFSRANPRSGAYSLSPCPRHRPNHASPLTALMIMSLRPTDWPRTSSLLALAHRACSPPPRAPPCRRQRNSHSNPQCNSPLLAPPRARPLDQGTSVSRLPPHVPLPLQRHALPLRLAEVWYRAVRTTVSHGQQPTSRR